MLAGGDTSRLAALVRIGTFAFAFAALVAFSREHSFAHSSGLTWNSEDRMLPEIQCEILSFMKTEGLGTKSIL